MDDSWNVAENRKENVDTEVTPDAFLHKNTNGRNEDGESNLDDIATNCSQVSLDALFVAPCL